MSDPLVNAVEAERTQEVHLQRVRDFFWSPADGPPSPQFSLSLGVSSVGVVTGYIVRQDKWQRKLCLHDAPVHEYKHLDYTCTAHLPGLFNYMHKPSASNFAALVITIISL